MKPSDPAVRRQLAVARRPLAGVLAGSAVTALVVIAQAFVLAGFIVAAVRGEELLGWAVAVAGVLGLRAVSGLVTDRCAARAAYDVGQQLREQVAQAALAGRYDGSTGALTTLLTRGITAAEPYLTRYLPALVLAMTLPVLTVVAITTQDLMSAFIVVVTLPLIPVFGILVGLATRDRATEQWRELSSLAGHFVDVMKGLPTLVAFGRAKAQAGTIRAITERYRTATMRTLRIGFLSSAILELVATISVALVAVTVGVRLASGGLDLRTALVVLLLAPEAYWPLRRVGAEFHASAEGLATFEQVAAITGEQDASPADSSALALGSGATIGPRIDGDLIVHQISVTYPGRRQRALAPLTATFPARGLTAVVGPSGSGKSTLLYAMLGLVEAGGTVTIGDEEIDPMTLRGQVAWVPQRPVFVDGDVADNLRMAAPDATDEHIAEVLRHVGLDAGLARDPRTLSAGQRARVALARVLISDRPVVFLDEPTAHLDAETERLIAATLTELARDRCVVVVAHRQSLVALADHVVALDVPPLAAPSRVATESGVTARRLPPQAATAVRRPSFARATLLAAGASLAGIALTATAGWLIVRAAEQPPVLALMVAIVGVRAFGLARPVLRYAERLLAHDAVLGLLAERRVSVYEAVVPLTPGALGRRRGDLLTSIVDDVESVSDRQLRVLMPLRSGMIAAAVTTGIATLILPAAGLVIGAVAVLTGGFSYLWSRRTAARVEPELLGARAMLGAATEDALQAREELLVWGATPAAVGTIVRHGRDLAASTLRIARAIATGRTVALLVTGAGIAAVGMVAQQAGAQVSGPMLALLVLTPLALLDVLLPFAEAGAMTARTALAERRLAALDHAEPLVTDPDAPRPLSESATITVTDLTAGWGDEPVLAGLSLQVAPGEKVGIVGPSGSGKSTLAALLVRFLDPDAGSVNLGERDLRELELADVRASVGLVDDDPHIFASTVAENLRLAKPGASDLELTDALDRAYLGDWRANLPYGLDTWLGDGHANISGGERARLAVARCLLVDSPVLVLDEPTAHLDTATATRVTDEILAAAEGKGVVWITHVDTDLPRLDAVVSL